MQANALWAGWDYAYVTFRRRSTFQMDAKKGKLIRIEKRVEFGNDKATTYAWLELEDGKEIKIPARQIIDTWEDYVAERDSRRKKRQEADAEAMRVREVQKHRDTAVANFLRQILAEAGIGIDRDYIVSVTYGTVSIPRIVIEEAMNGGQRNPTAAKAVGT